MNHIRGKSMDLLGQELNNRFINIGKIGNLKQELAGKYRDSENPEWDFFASVEYVSKTNSITRKQFKKQVDTDKSLDELAYKWKTFPKSVEKNIEKLEERRLGDTVTFPANLGGKNIDKNNTPSQKLPKNKTIQTKFWEFYRYEQEPPFDLVIDIDSEKEKVKNAAKDSYKQAQKIVNYLEKLDAPYSVKFSGNKGFHIHIQREHLEKYIDHGNYSIYNQKFAEFLSQKTGAALKSEDQGNSTAFIDDTIYKPKQIFRVPYTMHTSSGLLAIPLTREQFQNFELKYASPDYVRNNIELGYRGMCTRTGKANKLIKQFNEWQDKNNISITGSTPSQPQPKVRRSKVKQLAHDIQNLNSKEKQLLKQKVDY